MACSEACWQDAVYDGSHVKHNGLEDNIQTFGMRQPTTPHYM